MSDQQDENTLPPPTGFMDSPNIEGDALSSQFYPEPQPFDMEVANNTEHDNNTESANNIEKDDVEVQEQLAGMEVEEAITSDKVFEVENASNVPPNAQSEIEFNADFMDFLPPSLQDYVAGQKDDELNATLTEVKKTRRSSVFPNNRRKSCRRSVVSKPKTLEESVAEVSGQDALAQLLQVAMGKALQEAEGGALSECVEVSAEGVVEEVVRSLQAKGVTLATLLPPKKASVVPSKPSNNRPELSDKAAKQLRKEIETYKEASQKLHTEYYEWKRLERDRDAQSIEASKQYKEAKLGYVSIDCEEVKAVLGDADKLFLAGRPQLNNRAARVRSVITVRQVAAYDTQLLTQQMRCLGDRLKVATDHCYDVLDSAASFGEDPSPDPRDLLLQLQRDFLAAGQI